MIPQTLKIPYVRLQSSQISTQVKMPVRREVNIARGANTHECSKFPSNERKVSTTEMSPADREKLHSMLKVRRIRPKGRVVLPLSTEIKQPSRNEAHYDLKKSRGSSRPDKQVEPFLNRRRKRKSESQAAPSPMSAALPVSSCESVLVSPVYSSDDILIVQDILGYKLRKDRLLKYYEMKKETKPEKQKDSHAKNKRLHKVYPNDSPVLTSQKKQAVHHKAVNKTNCNINGIRSVRTTKMKRQA